jgi:hypothetical protein
MSNNRCKENSQIFCTDHAIVQYPLILPNSYRVQPQGQYSNVFNTLANALHYINDHEGRDKVLDHLQASLNYEEYEKTSKTQLGYAAHVMNKEVKGYNIKSYNNFDILLDRSIWPTLCMLKGSETGVYHAVTVVENYIFDSNNPTAIHLTKENLDNLCKAEYDSSITFIKVQQAYRFIKNNPNTHYFLRTTMKYRYALNAMIQCFTHLDNTNVVQSIIQHDPETMIGKDILGIVKNILMTKKHGFQTTKITCMNEIYQRYKGCYPVIALLHIKNTFHYSILCMIDGLIFNGKHDFSVIFTLDNLKSSIISETDSNIVHEDIEMVKGYVFYNSYKIESVDNQIIKKQKLY